MGKDLSRLQQYMKLQQSMTPQQIQFMNMLVCTNVELEQMIRTELESNPVYDVDASLDSERMDDAESQQEGEPDEENEEVDDYLDELMPAEDSDDAAYEIPKGCVISSADDSNCDYGGNESALQSLHEQVNYLTLTDRDHLIVDFLVDSLDRRGFLEWQPDMLADDFLNANGDYVSPEELESGRRVLRTLEPIGVGAHDIRDCYLMQLEAMEQTGEVELLERVVKYNYADLTNKSFKKIIATYNLTQEEFKSMLDSLSHLSRSPLDVFDEGSLSMRRTITPEFVVELEDDKVTVSLATMRFPKLKIAEQYAKIADQRKADETEYSSFVRNHVSKARVFISQLTQRQETMLVVMTAVAKIQKRYFLTGETIDLKPLTLVSLAKTLGLSLSIVSKALVGKYMQCPLGILPVKLLFLPGRLTADGKLVSREKVLIAIKEIVAGEDKSAPYSDSQIVDKLREKGYLLSRRAVVNYRQSLGIQDCVTRRQI